MAPAPRVKLRPTPRGGLDSPGKLRPSLIAREERKSAKLQKPRKLLTPQRQKLRLLERLQPRRKLLRPRERLMRLPNEQLEKT